ncbi:MAG: hypothetical protein HYY32_00795 [Chloroflexi bacterium]|nr:hypothetical protein [Chloroflexota bacterium]
MKRWIRPFSGRLRPGRWSYALVAAVAVSLVASCLRQPTETSAALGQKVSLAPGQAVSIQGERLSIRFVEVVTDSRCPTGVNCIRAGEVSTLVDITFRDSSHRQVFTQPGSAQGKAGFEDYEITFEVQPYPQAAKQISKEDYRLTLEVNKKAPLKGGILATFQVVDEKYSVFITNKETIEQVFAVQRGESLATIPSGRVIRGPVPHNQPWSWHIDSEEVGMAEATIELCDGKPSHVETNLDYWVDTVRFFCPWSAKLDRVQDFR